ncbi:hypothetical protein D3C84_1277260 [compost metagenome]
MRLAVEGDRDRDTGDLLLLHHRFDGGLDDGFDAVVRHAVTGTEEKYESAVGREFFQVVFRHG